MKHFVVLIILFSFFTNLFSQIFPKQEITIINDNNTKIEIINIEYSENIATIICNIDISQKNSFGKVFLKIRYKNKEMNEWQYTSYINNELYKQGINIIKWEYSKYIKDNIKDYEIILEAFVYDFANKIKNISEIRIKDFEKFDRIFIDSIQINNYNILIESGKHNFEFYIDSIDSIIKTPYSSAKFDMEIEPDSIYDIAVNLIPKRPDNSFIDKMGKIGALIGAVSLTIFVSTEEISIGAMMEGAVSGALIGWIVFPFCIPKVMDILNRQRIWDSQYKDKI